MPPADACTRGPAAAPTAELRPTTKPATRPMATAPAASAPTFAYRPVIFIWLPFHARPDPPRRSRLTGPQDGPPQGSQRPADHAKGAELRTNARCKISCPRSQRRDQTNQRVPRGEHAAVRLSQPGRVRIGHA